MRAAIHILIGLLTASVDISSASEAHAQAGPPLPSVTVAKPAKRLVADRDEYVGQFVAVDAIESRARVSGYLAGVHFEDGQFVKQGDLLFTIDKRPFEATVAQAKANVAQAKANLAYAEADLARAQNLVGRAVISEQTFEQRTQAKRVAEASVASQEAALRQAELDLGFTELRSPISGRIGDRRVSPGNLVTGGTGTTTLLATITSTDPIRFEFTFDETSYLRYLRLTDGTGTSRQGMTTPVRLKLIDEPKFTHEGRMDFVDNAIDRASGTIRGRAIFPNPKGVLTPGMFARIELSAGASVERLLLPDTAIGTEQVRKFVLIADAESVARPSTSRSAGSSTGSGSS